MISLIAVLKAKPGQTDALREAWQGQDALDAHVAMPYFQAFMTQMESLLAEPLRLDFLTPVEP